MANIPVRSTNPVPNALPDDNSTPAIPRQKAQTGAETADPALRRRSDQSMRTHIQRQRSDGGLQNAPLASVPDSQQMFAALRTMGPAELSQLLEAGGDANAPDPDTGHTPLTALMRRSDIGTHGAELIALLLAHGANPDVAEVQNMHLPPDAHHAPSPPMGQTAQHLAAANSDIPPEIIIQLLQKSANPNPEKGGHKHTPLREAAVNLNRPAVAALLADPRTILNQTFDHGLTLERLLRSRDDKEAQAIANLLASRRAPAPELPATTRAGLEHFLTDSNAQKDLEKKIGGMYTRELTNTIRARIEHNIAIPDDLMHLGMTLLPAPQVAMLIAAGGNVHYIAPLLNRNALQVLMYRDELRKRELEKPVSEPLPGEDAEATLARQPRPELYERADINEIGQMLIDAGVSLDHRDGAGMTPVGSAARRGNPELLRAMFASGRAGSPDARMGDGFTLLANAAASQSSECVAVMLNVGANMALKSHVEQGVTFVHDVAIYGDQDMLDLVKDHPVFLSKLNEKERLGQAPIWYAVGHPFRDQGKTLNQPVFEFLMAHNADINEAITINNAPLRIRDVSGSLSAEQARAVVAHGAKFTSELKA